MEGDISMNLKWPINENKSPEFSGTCQYEFCLSHLNQVDAVPYVKKVSIFTWFLYVVHSENKEAKRANFVVHNVDNHYIGQINK